MTNDLPPSPLAPRKERRFREHGHSRVDEYFWLRDREHDPEVMAYLEAENAYRDRLLQPLAGLRERLWNELKGRLVEDDVSVPAPKGAFEYYHRTEAGKQYPFYCRRPRAPSATQRTTEQVLLDLNALATQHKYVALGDQSLSPDDQWLAYTLDVDGSEMHRLFVRNLVTGQTQDLGLENLAAPVEWSADSQYLFYVKQNKSQRPYRLYRRDARGRDTLVYEEKDPEIFLHFGKSRDERHFILSLDGKITSEAWLAPTDDARAPFRVVAPRRHGHEYSVEVHGERLFILTNDGARNFRLCEAPLAKPARRNWREVIPHSAERYLEDFEVFRDFLVVHELAAGLPALRVRAIASGDEHLVTFPDAAYHLFSGTNLEFNSGTLRFGYTSLVAPHSVYDYDLATRERRLRKRLAVPGGYDPEQYVSERIHAVSHDGARVPVSIVYRKGTPRDGSAPLYLYGYGAYGLNCPPGFSTDRLSLLDRGVTFAIAHVRGGADLGREWYEQGKFLHKQNTFLDFIAAAEHLQAQGYTQRDRTVICGGSAGGLLVGAVLNRRPELFHAAVAHVPFVDVLNTMLDATLPLTPLEYDEWGNPAERQYYDAIRAYSPYDNVEAQAYPHLLVTCGLNDPRVTYWEPAKWVARLRALKTDSNWLVLDTNMDAGHGGASGRYDHLKLVALEQAFLLRLLGVA
jgi:oligopeptidase B